MSFTEKLAGMSIVNVIFLSIILIIIRIYLKDTSNPILKQVAEFAESLAFAFLLVFLVIRPFFIQSFYIPSASMRPGLLENDHIVANKFIYFFKDPSFGDVVIFKAPNEAVIDKASYRPYTVPNDKFRRFMDVITNKDTRLDFIKRVIGEPGDEIRITPGYILTAKSSYYPEGVIFHRDLRDRLSVFAKPGKDGKVKLIKDAVLIDGEKLDTDKVREALRLGKDDKFDIHPGTVYRNGKALDEPYTAEDPELPYPITGLKTIKPDWIVKKNGESWVKVPEGKYLVMGDNRNDSFDARFWGLLDRDSIKGKALILFWPLNRIKLVK